MRKLALVALLALSACGSPMAPKTPAQASLEAWAALGAATSAFNSYASQRPFCGMPDAKPAPLCADRAVVIEGNDAAHMVADGLTRADAVIKATNTADTQWAALADPLKALVGFQAIVAKTGK